MSSGSPNLAIGELVGAASFITTVVTGSMVLFKPFKVNKGPFIRDAGFLLVTAVFILYIILTMELHLWQSVVMLAFYFFYVAFVMGYHRWLIWKEVASQNDDHLSRVEMRKTLPEPLAKHNPFYTPNQLLRRQAGSTTTRHLRKYEHKQAFSALLSFDGTVNSKR